MKKVFILSLIGLFLSLSMTECASSGPSKRSKGRQQPKKGPMPCPMKDC